MIARHAASVGLVLATLAGLVTTLLGRPIAALVLTVTAAVGIINSLWLERVMVRMLQPGRAQVSRGTAALIVARMGLWGLLFAVVFVLRQYVELWAVAAGMGCFLVALAVAGLGREHGEGREE